MARRLISMSITEYVRNWYMRGPSHNAWFDPSRFITDIDERPKRVFVVYVLYLSDNSTVTVDGNCTVDVECY